MIKLVGTRVTGKFRTMVDVEVSLLALMWSKAFIAIFALANNNSVVIDDKR